MKLLDPNLDKKLKLWEGSSWQMKLPNQNLEKKLKLWEGSS